MEEESRKVTDSQNQNGRRTRRNSEAGGGYLSAPQGGGRVTRRNSSLTMSSSTLNRPKKRLPFIYVVTYLQTISDQSVLTQEHQQGKMTMMVRARMGSSDISGDSFRATADWGTEDQMAATSPWGSQTSGSNRSEK